MTRAGTDPAPHGPEMAPADGAADTPPMPTWATVSTMKETPKVVMNFVAHHLLLGASEIIIFFDDPDDPCIDLLGHIPQVRAMRGGTAFVESFGKSAESLPARQKFHARLAYRMVKSDWIIHIDADEFIATDRPIAEYLAMAQNKAIRLVPFEALATPRSAQDGRPENYYRGGLPDTDQGARIAAAAYGPFERSLTAGRLSHAAGKFFVRTRIPDMKLSVHSPWQGPKRAARDVYSGLYLLHFHGGDFTTWRNHLGRRLSADAGGTYSEKLQGKPRQPGSETLLDTLRRLLQDEGEDGLARFFRATCTYGPEKRALRHVDALRQGNLWLDCKRAALFGEDHPIREPAFHPTTGRFEVTTEWENLTLRLAPDDSYEECQIARQQLLYPELLDILRKAMALRPILLTDIGAGAGVIAQFVARHSQQGSSVIAFERGADERRRLAENAARNGLTDRVSVVDGDLADVSVSAADERLSILRFQATADDQVEAFARLVATSRPDILVVHPRRNAGFAELPPATLPDVAPIFTSRGMQVFSNLAALGAPKLAKETP